MNTATHVKNLDGFRGRAALYELSEPVGYDIDWDTDEARRHTRYVVISAADVPFSGPETYIFPADESGEIVNWGELDGSYKGGLCHETAIREAGWEIAS